MMNKYEGLTLEQLAKHADEGWRLLHLLALAFHDPKKLWDLRK